MSSNQGFEIEYGTLVKYTGPGGEVTLPDEVTAIGEGAFWACKTITSIVIPDRVKSIEKQAFGWCESLERVTLPAGITRIENRTFVRCRSLREINFPAELKEIGAGAFFGCESLTELDLPEGLESIEAKLMVHGGCFQECTGLTRLRIPASLKNIYGPVFRGCTSLETIEVDPANPSFVVENGLLIDKDEHILRFCPPGITGVLEIPEGVTYLPWGCFEGCVNLTGVVFPASLEIISGKVFMGCTGLTSIRIPDGVKMDFCGVFEGCTSLTDVTLPADLESLDTDFFKGCTALKSVSLPEGLKKIDSSAFQDSGLETITIPASVADIYVSAFQGCKSLTEILVDPQNTNYYSTDGMLVYKKAGWNSTSYVLKCCPPGKTGVCFIPAEITQVTSPAFDGCDGLTAFEVDPASEYLEALDGLLAGKYEGDSYDYHMKGTLVRCPIGRTGECVVPEGITRLRDKAFEGCAQLTRICLPKSLKNDGQGTFLHCTSLLEIVVDPENEAFHTLDGMLMRNLGEDSWGSGKLAAYPAGRAVGDIVIPEGVESIGRNAFQDCMDLTGVTVPAGIKEIGYDAFNGCWNLARVVLSEGVKEIGSEAFNGCRNLARVVLSEGVKKIGSGAFQGCRNLEQVVLPEGLEELGFHVFGYYSDNETEKLTEVALPRSIKRFGAYPFYILPEGIFQEPEKRDGCFADQLEQKSTLKRLTPKDWAGIFLFQTTKKFKEACQRNMTKSMDLYVEGMAELLLEHGSGPRFTKAAEFVQDHMDKLKPETVSKLYEAAAAKKAKKAMELLAPLVSSQKKTKRKKAADPNDPAAALREKFSEPMLLKRFKDRKGVLNGLKKVKMADGSKAPDLVTLCAIVPYAAQYEYSNKTVSYERDWLKVKETPDADAAAALLDRASLLALLDTLVTRHSSWYIPYCRYADGKRITSLNSRMREWASWYAYGASGRSDIMTVRGALMLSDTREAMLILDKGAYKDQLLGEYARRRGTDAAALRDTVLAEFGLDENGKKVCDLGGNTVTISLTPELKLSIFDENAQKEVKSIPKKGADEAKYDAAKADLSAMKKNIKKVVKSRCDQLFLQFLSGESWKAGAWKDAYMGKNPILRQVASLLVWSQGEASFTLKDGAPIGPDGAAYVIGEEPIRLAYPTELPREDLETWRSYFANNAIKQPFAQVWEPALRAEDIREDRYQDCEVPAYRFKGQEKHGISFDFGIGVSELYISFRDCDLEYDAERAVSRHMLELDETLTLGKFTFKKYTRQVNHIAALLDKWTIIGRILKDDVTVMAQLDGATLPQVMEYLNLAIDNGKTNVTAELLNYKNEHYPNFDPLAEFTLEDL